MAYQQKQKNEPKPMPMKIFRTNANACDFCDEEPVILIHLANGLQICPACRKEDV